MDRERDLTKMTPEEIVASLDFDKIFITENGRPWSWKPFYVRAYERGRERWRRLRGRQEAEAKG